MTYTKDALVQQPTDKQDDRRFGRLFWMTDIKLRDSDMKNTKPTVDFVYNKREVKVQLFMFYCNIMLNKSKLTIYVNIQR